jgi:hypothetical protein
MNTDTLPSKRVIIIAALFVSLLVGLASYGLYSQNINSRDGTVPENRLPETFGVNPAEPVTVGFEKLIDEYGMTFEDADKAQIMISRYIADSKEFPPQATIELESADVYMPEDDLFNTYNIKFKVDNKPMTGSIKTDRSGPITLTIDKSDGTKYTETL